MESIKPKDIQRKWYVVDANGQILGRMATRIATILRGKHRSYFSPQWDMGDYVVVINASKVDVTGNKKNNKLYEHHTGYPGGMVTKTFKQLRSEHPEKVIELAVRRMLPKNRLSRQVLEKMYVYAGAEHPHNAQKPEELKI